MSNKAAIGARSAQARPANKAKNKASMTEKARVRGRGLTSLVPLGTSVPRHNNTPSQNTLRKALLKSGIKQREPNNFKYQHQHKATSDKANKDIQQHTRQHTGKIAQ
jgi:hypothetical protein